MSSTMIHVKFHGIKMSQHFVFTFFYKEGLGYYILLLQLFKMPSGFLGKLFYWPRNMTGSFNEDVRNLEVI